MNRKSPLPNRVDPFGELISTPARGLLLGNRGGRFHVPPDGLGTRRWASRQWIACVCEFKGRTREVWNTGYTELFFLDEITAFAAGHRPCFECRRADAQAFQAAWVSSGDKPSAPQMDVMLHVQRLDGKAKRLHEMALDDLPDGAMIAKGDKAYALRGDALLPWRIDGYGAPLKRPGGEAAKVLTPPAIVDVLKRGYRPLWHPSAVTKSNQQRE